MNILIEYKFCSMQRYTKSININSSFIGYVFIHNFKTNGYSVIITKVDIYTNHIIESIIILYDE